MAPTIENVLACLGDLLGRPLRDVHALQALWREVEPRRRLALAVSAEGDRLYLSEEEGETAEEEGETAEADGTGEPAGSSGVMGRVSGALAPRGASAAPVDVYVFQC